MAEEYPGPSSDEVKKSLYLHDMVSEKMNMILDRWLAAIWKAAAVALPALALTLASCSKSEPMQVGRPAVRVVSAEKRNVLLLYSAGFNSLSSDLESDVEDLASGWLPLTNSESSVVMLYSRRKAASGNYSDLTPSYLIRLSSDKWGNTVRDTVKTWPRESLAASVETFHDVLSTVSGMYPGSRFGMIFSSHATGWLPPGYYSTGKISLPSAASGYGLLSSVPVGFEDLPDDPSAPRVKSIGADNITSRSTYEMDIEEFAEAIPMKFDYIIMDACLMGGIETAYALKDKCSRLIFSQAEVLADGLCDYSTLTRRLLGGTGPDLMGLCEDSFARYAAQTDVVYKSITISMIDCSKLEPLADACRSLFSEYRANLIGVQPDEVQGFFRYNKHWFYDLEDILVKSRIPESALTDFRNAMDGCVLYKAASEKFINFDIDEFCGLSMYLPADGDMVLNDYYRGLSWNKATGLVL